MFCFALFVLSSITYTIRVQVISARAGSRWNCARFFCLTGIVNYSKSNLRNLLTVCFSWAILLVKCFVLWCVFPLAWNTFSLSIYTPFCCDKWNFPCEKVLPVFAWKHPAIESFWLWTHLRMYNVFSHFGKDLFWENMKLC